MLVEEFVKNNRDINDGSNLPDELLISTYENIKNKEFYTPNRCKFLNEYNESLWKCFQHMQYSTEGQTLKEIDSSVLLDMNDLTKQQINQRTNNFISCSSLTPVLNRYIAKAFMDYFMGFLLKTKLNCISIFIIYIDTTWKSINQPDFITLSLKTIENCIETCAIHSSTKHLDGLMVMF